MSDSKPMAANQDADREPGRGFPAWLRHTVMPVALAIVCLLLYLWIHSKQLDSIEQRSLNAQTISRLLLQHIELTLVSTVGVIAIAVPLGILLTRRFMRRLTPAITAIVGIGQAVPSIGVLVLLAIAVGLGFWPAVAAFVLYTIVPVLRNTMVGLTQIDSAVIEAGRGMGMSRAAVLFRIELPLAVPVMLAGIRTALVILVGTATLATFVSAGGLGQLIVTGNNLGRTTILVTGGVLSAVLALLIDWLAGIAEIWLRPRGL
ncbi:ABC transporter permease [Salinisphaera sp.]|uniref:ABC transporter permease n=1 Tax=Salinisphaera sp. TaxID=1914330 RepID=UPI002D773BB0|nr:ABC transporter permease [Salinisphaera sp.]HET7313018.1 ABC transporter permease [Salinisphaera sp.]